MWARRNEWTMTLMFRSVPPSPCAWWDAIHRWARHLPAENSTRAIKPAFCFSVNQLVVIFGHHFRSRDVEILPWLKLILPSKLSAVSNSIPRRAKSGCKSQITQEISAYVPGKALLSKVRSRFCSGIQGKDCDMAALVGSPMVKGNPNPVSPI